jgi:hypothetical protein
MSMKNSNDTIGNLITRTQESYRMWCVVVWDVDTSRMRRTWPVLGRRDIGGEKNVASITAFWLKGLAQVAGSIWQQKWQVEQIVKTSVRQNNSATCTPPCSCYLQQDFSPAADRKADNRQNDAHASSVNSLRHDKMHEHALKLPLNDYIKPFMAELCPI